MEQVILWIEQTIGIRPELQGKIFNSLIIIAILWLLNQLVLRFVIYRISDTRIRYQWQKVTGYIAFFIASLAVGRIWFEGVETVATFLGLLSAGLAIALKEPITNLFGWAFILWRKPFEVGDRVQVGDVAGDVIDQRVFQFTLMEIGNWVDADQSTGRILHVPNGMVFTAVIANYTKGSDYIWNEIPVLITFESNWEKAKQLLENIINNHVDLYSQNIERSFQDATWKFLIKYNKLTPIVYTNVKASGVLLTIRYLCDPRQRRSSGQDIWEAILRAFAKHDDIDLAYPTQRFYFHANGEIQKVEEFSRGVGAQEKL